MTPTEPQSALHRHVREFIDSCGWMAEFAPEVPDLPVKRWGTLGWARFADELLGENARLEAAGERDKAEREAFHKALADEGLPEDASVDDLIRHHRGNAALVADANAFAERERDRQQIARLTEALEAALDRLVHVNGNTLLTIYETQQIIRAVLAGEEDAANG